MQPHEFFAAISYRYLHSFREFHGSDEIDPHHFLFADTRINGFDFSAAYQVTERFSLSLEVPFQDGRRRSYYEHDITTFKELHTMDAGGIGDVKLVANYWVLEPASHPTGNIIVGLGVSFPTGQYDAMDYSYRSTGKVLRPVDPAIQPGTGGWGIVTEIAGFQQIYRDLFGYMQGEYLFQPRDINHVQQTTGDEPDFTLNQFGYIWNSVPDQYLGRLGIGYAFWPKIGFAVTFGGRVEGVPVEDLLGSSNGWRNAGYAVSVEPGITIAKGRYAFNFTVPVAVLRHADKNLTDVHVTKKFGFDAGGNAAFADYLITSSFSIRF